MRKTFAVVLAATILSGCTTTSFSPPHLEKNAKLDSVSRNGCATNKDGTVKIQADVIGALQLINNFELIYTCAADEAADGRQIFEVPSFLTTAAGLVGASFGLSADQILVTGASASVLNAGKSYYAPREKAGMLGDALRAINCVRTEAVGISYFRTREDDQSNDPTPQFMAIAGKIDRLRDREKTVRQLSFQLQPNDVNQANLYGSEIDSINKMIAYLVDQQQALAENISDGEVNLNAERQYFEMISGALGAIHLVLGNRLRDAGKADMEDIFSKLKELVKEEEEGEQKLNAALTSRKSAFGALLVQANRDVVTLENQKLRTELQVCVLQARA